jgi:carbon starvation protein CstA
MLIVEVWKNKESAIPGLLSIFIALFWPVLILGNLNKWIQILFYKFPTNVLYPILSIFIGTFIAIYVYNKKHNSHCSLESIATGISASFIGTIFGLCPACIPVLALLPLSITATLSYMSWILSLISIFLLLFVIYKMNGFEKIEKIGGAKYSRRNRKKR